MVRGVPSGKEEVDFHRSDAKLKFLISYDLFARGEKIQPRCVFKKEFFLSGCHQIDQLSLYLFSSSFPSHSCHSYGSRSMFGQQLRKVLQAEWDTRCVVGTMAQISDLKNKAASDQ